MPRWDKEVTLLIKFVTNPKINDLHQNWILAKYLIGLCEQEQSLHMVSAEFLQQAQTPNKLCK